MNNKYLIDTSGGLPPIPTDIVPLIPPVDIRGDYSPPIPAAALPPKLIIHHPGAPVRGIPMAPAPLRQPPPLAARWIHRAPIAPLRTPHSHRHIYPMVINRQLKCHRDHVHSHPLFKHGLFPYNDLSLFNGDLLKKMYMKALLKDEIRREYDAERKKKLIEREIQRLLFLDVKPKRKTTRKSPRRRRTPKKRKSPKKRKRSSKKKSKKKKRLNKK